MAEEKRNKIREGNIARRKKVAASNDEQWNPGAQEAGYSDWRAMRRALVNDPRFSQLSEDDKFYYWHRGPRGWINEFGLGQGPSATPEAAPAAPVQTRAKDAKYAMTPAMINPLGYAKPIMSPTGRPSPGPIPPGGGILSGAAAGPTTRPAQVGPILGASDVIKQNAAPVGQAAPVAPQGRSYLPQTPQTPSQFSQPGGGRQQSKRNSFTMGGLFA